MATKKQKEELMQTLKFAPRTYRLMLSGSGGEIVLGSIPCKQYRYFIDHAIDIEEFANDWENNQEVPEDMQPFDPGSWPECDDIAHENGCELDGSNYITVFDENDDEVWKCMLDVDSLTTASVEAIETGEYMCSDRPDRKNTVGFIGQSIEKGVFYYGDVKLTAPFDPTKLKVGYDDIEGWCLVTSVSYNGIDIDGYDGADTRSKGFEFKFYDVEFE